MRSCPSRNAVTSNGTASPENAEGSYSPPGTDGLGARNGIARRDRVGLGGRDGGPERNLGFAAEDGRWGEGIGHGSNLLPHARYAVPDAALSTRNRSIAVVGSVTTSPGAYAISSVDARSSKLDHRPT